MAERILRRELGQHLTGMDNTCLQLEHPRRRMAICILMTFNERLDTTLVMAALENLCTHYPRFCLIPQHTSPWETSVWSRPHRQWKFRDNFVFHTLENPTLTCLQHYVANQYVKPFDRNKPLWEAHLISGLENKHCAFLWKVHHCMSDSIGLLRALLAATTSMDPKEEMYRQWQQQQQQYQLMQRQRRGYGSRKPNNNNGTFDRRFYHHQCLARQRYQQLQYEKAKRKFGMFWQQMMVWLLWGWSLMGVVMQQASYELATLRLLAMPWFYQCKKHLFLLRPLRYLFLNYQQQQQQTHTWPDNNDDQAPGKQMAWTNNLDNGDFQKVQRLIGGSTDEHRTLDEVILLLLGRAMQRYKQQHKQQPVHNDNNDDTYRILYPVTFRHPMDWSMKNATLGSLLVLKMGNGNRQLASPPPPPTTTVESLNTIHQHRIASQRSLLPSVVHTLFVECLLRYFPFLMVPHWVQQWYADLPHATMTSIAGPTTAVFFGGQVMNECYVLPSQGGKDSICVGVLSYSDKINLSITTDDHPAYPDLATSLCKLFEAELNAVVDEAVVMASGYGDGGIIM